ncbi:CehA/McbA family metallohydrolase [Paenibacillus lignilyticus]|uniref:CehA/McbA family metallohydrolase n=1 Tax=Paenibacillus lignilyticus TaxID=1172615 RepID=A0ABS5C7D0_9BACL|nr:CehA/McbA family metallohydrolase [Paenibacillus lignilyticus]MBP3961899.1 CehA/McbA family metallohydrolase [Paenibacillus lignilyticus]
MKILNSYTQTGKWWRGSFHNHTTNSDGWFPLETVYKMYGGYDFLGISDHDKITKHEGERSIPTVFDAIEVSSRQTHMLLVNPPHTMLDDYSNEFTIENYQRLADMAVDNGGFAVLVHPNRFFSNYWTLEDMLKLERYIGIEVYNGDGNPEYDIAFDKWDALLSSGRKVWGFGNDDSHVYGQEKRAWNMVQAEENTNEAITQAIKNGNFYVSTGYGFDAIRTEGHTIIIDLRSNELLDKMYKYVTFFGKDGRVLQETTGRISQATYECKGDEGYVRIAAYLEGGYGAFSQPLFVESSK